MKFGLHLIQQNIELAELRKLWRWADGAGFDWIDVSDHFMEAPLTEKHGGYLECISCLAALAIDTQNVRIGQLVFGMNYRHPAVLAKALATIDHLSDGRLEIGLGAGWHEAEYRAYGIPFPAIGERLDILEEGIQVVRMLMTMERATYVGDHFTLTDATCDPKPLQANPRIWVGGNGEQRTLRIVARHCDGWNSPYTSPDEVARLSGVLDQWCERESRDPASIERNVNLAFHLAANEAARPRAEAHFRDAWGSDPRADAVRNAGSVLGTPSEAVDFVGRYADAGMARVLIAVRPPLDWEALHAWAEEVIPQFDAP